MINVREVGWYLSKAPAGWKFEVLRRTFFIWNLFSDFVYLFFFFILFFYVKSKVSRLSSFLRLLFHVGFFFNEWNLAFKVVLRMFFFSKIDYFIIKQKDSKILLIPNKNYIQLKFLEFIYPRPLKNQNSWKLSELVNTIFIQK